MKTWKKVRKIANRKVLLAAILIITLVSSLGGIFLLSRGEDLPEEQEEIRYSNSEDYVIKETEEGKVVENENAGLSFKVPDGWRTDKPEAAIYITLYSPDAEGTTMGPEGLTTGCEIMAQVMYIRANVEIIEQGLRESHQGELFANDEYEIIEIDGHKALKNKVEIIPLNLSGTSIHVPVNDFSEGKLHFLRVGSNLEEKEKCIQEFEEFLKTVSINS